MQEIKRRNRSSWGVHGTVSNPKSTKAFFLHTLRAIVRTVFEKCLYTGLFREWAQRFPETWRGLRFREFRRLIPETTENVSQCQGYLILIKSKIQRKSYCKSDYQYIFIRNHQPFVVSVSNRECPSTYSGRTEECKKTSGLSTFAWRVGCVGAALAAALPQLGDRKGRPYTFTRQLKLAETLGIITWVRDKQSFFLFCSKNFLDKIVINTI